MSRARNLADLLDANGDVASGALDNVPPSNDASALTTGTLPIARIADGDITAAKLGSTLDLSGKTVTLPEGVGGKVLKMYQMQTNYTLVTSSTFVEIAAQAVVPTNSSTKFLLMLNGGRVVTNAAGRRLFTTFSRTGVNLAGTDGYMCGYLGVGTEIELPHSMTWLDAHGQSAGFTYYVYAKISGGSVYWTTGAVQPHFVILEIAP